MDPEARAVRIADRRLGLITTRQRSECGFSRWHIQTRSGRRQLAGVRRGVWALAGSPATPERSILAAVLACGPQTVASHDMFDHDADREADLASIGWELLTFTSRSTPQRLRAAVLGAVKARAAGDTGTRFLAESTR